MPTSRYSTFKQIASRELLPGRSRMSQDSLRARLTQFFIAHTMVLAGRYTKPSFMIIGVQGGGTTALASYLRQHPFVEKGQRKEIHYFDRLYHRGTRWYHSMFPLPNQKNVGLIAYDATPAYIYEREVPERIYRYDPQMKLVLMLRNPIDRAYSAWNKAGFAHYGYTSFAEMAHGEVKKITREKLVYAPNGQPSFLQRGLYRPQIERYHKIFPRDQLLILENQQLVEQPAETLRRMSNHVGLPEHPWETVEYKRRNKGTYKETMTPKTRAELAEFFRPFNEELYDLIGVNYGWE